MSDDAGASLRYTSQLFSLQVAVYRAVLKSQTITSLLYSSGTSDTGVLPAITILRKLCNHPRLLMSTSDSSQSAGAGAAAAAVAQNLGEACLDLIEHSGAVPNTCHLVFTPQLHHGMLPTLTYC